jgi:small subunit ribosomal protein S21
MSGIRVRDGESFESAMRRFKKACEKSGILADIRRHEYYEKPSVKKKKKAIAARKRAKKKGRPKIDKDKAKAKEKEKPRY